MQIDYELARSGLIQIDKETKRKIYKYYGYYELWYDLNQQRNKSIYALFINCDLKKSDLGKMFNLSTSRISQIIEKQQRKNDYSHELPSLHLLRDVKDDQKRIKSVINYWDLYIKDKEEKIINGQEMKNFALLELKKLREGQAAK
jgi:hypothetical protein